MKIEKLTENKIRITLNMEDLKNQNLDFHTFMSNSIETQDIFIEMLKEAEKRVGFNTDDYRLMLEAIAIPNGNFVLTVTRMKEVEKPRSKRIQIKRKTIALDKNVAIYKFNVFDDFCEFCTYLSNLDLIKSMDKVKKNTLHLYENNYYLILNDLVVEETALKKFCSVITEFASYIANPTIFENRIYEYGKDVIKKDALKTGVKYFAIR
jgi:adapter protein MecA 1/2